MNPIGLVDFRPGGKVSCLGMPASLVKRASRLSSKYTLTSRRCAMNVMEDTRNRVKSNAVGIGAGSRRSISNVVHGSSVWLGRLPRRANNLRNVSLLISGHECYAYLIFPVLPIKPHPLPSGRDEGLLGSGKQTVETNTERSDLLLVRIPFSWIQASAVQKSHVGLSRTDLLQSIPVLVSE